MPFHISPGTLSLAGSATLVAMFIASLSAAQAGPAERLWEDLQLQAVGCGTAGDGSMSTGARCLFGNSLNFLLEESMRLAGEYGGKAFGQRFQVVGKPAFAPASGGTGSAADLDVVVPFAGAEPSVAEKPSGSALFLQQGVTHWQDGLGTPRNDLRYGLVYRFRVSDRPDADILGLSVLQLHNAERQHRVLVSGIDYSGRWGSGSLRHFMPTTGWRSNRRGPEERALGGTEFSTRLDLTSTLDMNATGYRRESGNGSGRRNEGVRMGFAWRPHPWLQLGAGYDRYSGGDGAVAFRIGFRMPLGSPSKPPLWEGLGVAAGGSAPGDSELWRPVEGDSRILTATRESVSDLVNEAEVRFLQDTVESGDSILLEVVLPSVAPEDIRVEVRLVPGSGANPAVPGEDFVDEPVALTIPAGATGGTVTIQLLRNGDQQENRSLGASVSLVS